MVKTVAQRHAAGNGALTNERVMLVPIDAVASPQIPSSFFFSAANSSSVRIPCSFSSFSPLI